MLLSIGYDPVPAVTVPEPATFTLLGASLLGFGALRRRRRI
jgi:PEP-CTERM motif